MTRRAGALLPFQPTTEYINTIPPELEPSMPGDANLEWKIRSVIRWNAMAMVVRANRKPGELGGHIASFASSATLYDVGFNHFWRAPSGDHPGDLLYIQGHSSPGIYSRAFLEGRISESQIDNFRMEVDGKGISSYPHPYLMPEFWQTPTVSMGLGPISAIYQARFWKYLEGRGLMPKSDRKIWCCLGDGETDEPESLGAISLAGREGLDNLIFVVNCNLQRLDGPLPRTGPSRRCRLQFTTKIRLSRPSRPASEIAPSDPGSSVSPSPRKHQILRSDFGIRPRPSRYFQKRAW